MDAEVRTAVRAGRKPQRWGCSVEGCDKEHRARGYCMGHYSRWKRLGDPGSTQLQARKITKAACELDGCDRPHYARGYCSPHYSRWLLTGNAAPEKPVKGRRADPNWTPGYDAWHQQIRDAHGPASAHTCHDCSGQAAQWSYDNSDPEELYAPGINCHYSLDMTRYVPRCFPCHGAVDAAHRKAQGRPRGSALYPKIAEYYRALIHSGELLAGERLPSASKMTERWGVRRVTIQKALALLRDEGWIETRQAHLPVVLGEPGRVPEQMAS